jgi:hypothetical protein
MNTGIEIKLSFCWFNIASWFTKPVITINDVERYERKWGTHFFKLQAGEHRIKIFVPNLNINASYELSIKEGAVARLSFFANPLKASIC